MCLLAWLIHQEGFMSLLQKRRSSPRPHMLRQPSWEMAFTASFFSCMNRNWWSSLHKWVCHVLLFSKNLSGSCRRRNGRKEGCIIHSLCVEEKKDNFFFFFFEPRTLKMIPFPSSSVRLYSTHPLINSHARCKQVRGNGNLSFPL